MRQRIIMKRLAEKVLNLTFGTVTTKEKNISKEIERIKTHSTKVSILLPVKDAQDTLDVCLRSIINQSFTNWELVAIDDFSTDKSYALLTQFYQKDSRIKVYRNLKTGIVNGLNQGISLAKSDFIARMDADDIMYEDRIEKQVKFMKETPDCILCGSQVNMFKITLLSFFQATLCCFSGAYCASTYENNVRATKACQGCQEPEPADLRFLPCTRSVSYTHLTLPTTPYV